MLCARVEPEKKNPRRAEDKGLQGAKDLIIKGDRLKHARHMMMIMSIINRHQHVGSGSIIIIKRSGCLIAMLGPNLRALVIPEKPSE